MTSPKALFVRWLLAAASLFLLALVSSSAPFRALAASPIAEYPLPSPDSAPNVIAVGSDGNMWFTEQNYEKIGKITPAGEIVEYSQGLTGSRLGGITPGPDGNAWFTELFARVGKITPEGRITDYSGVSSPYMISAAPDGNLWFTDNGNNSIGRITPQGQVTEYYLAGSVPYGITLGPDGNIWFTGDHLIGKVALDGQITTYPVNSPAGPYGITAGPDDKLWYTDRWDSRIGSMALDGGITEYYLPPNSEPADITTGADGNLWFTEFAGNRVGKITPGGFITEYPVPTQNSGPNGIRPDLAGNLWFTEYKGNQVGTAALCTGKLGAPYAMAPRAITALTVTDPVLFWVPGFCATSYTVVLKLGSTGGQVLCYKKGITDVLYHLPRLPEHHSYYWQVQACKGERCVPSQWRQFTIP